VEECGPCPVFASFTLAFSLQLRTKHGRTSVRVRKTTVRLRKTSVRVQYTYYQNTHTLQNPNKHTYYLPPLTHTHITPPPPTHTHTHYKTILNHHSTNQNKHSARSAKCTTFGEIQNNLLFWTIIKMLLLRKNRNIISGSLSSRHGASSCCGWKNGVPRYEGYLRIY
jgi:archaellin